MEILLQTDQSQLPPYFDTMLPPLPNICDHYNIRLPTFHPPLIKHAFAEQRLDYQLIEILNANGSQAVILKAQSLFFMALCTLMVATMHCVKHVI